MLWVLDERFDLGTGGLLTGLSTLMASAFRDMWVSSSDSLSTTETALTKEGDEEVDRPPSTENPEGME